MERIEESRSALDDYYERAGQLASRDVDGWLDLARWASSRSLSAQANEAYHRVLATDPSNPEANQALGNVQVDGRCVSEEESYRARGYVQFEGEWMTPAQRDALVSREIQRPGHIRTEFTIQGMTGVYAFDGERGWEVSPFLGHFDARAMSPERVRQARQQADVDGPLVDWKAKGHRVTLEGRETVDGRETHRLAVTLAYGTVRHDFVDARTFLLVKTESTRLLLGHERDVVTTFDDYKGSRRARLRPLDRGLGARRGPTPECHRRHSGAEPDSRQGPLQDAGDATAAVDSMRARAPSAPPALQLPALASPRME